MDDQLPKLWERKTYASAVVSALLAGAVALTVCAFRGEAVALGQPTHVRVSTDHTAPPEGK